jgi:4-amino-4-deoxy-L-arabinose transferase-like glycosyltransferase
VAWSIVTPPFNAPDEPVHFAYVKQLAETGRLPVGSNSKFSLEEEVALADLRLEVVAEDPQNRTISSRAQQQRLQGDLDRYRGPPEAGREFAGVAASQPPLYYAIEAIPYELGASGTLLDRLELMRLLSAVMCGLTALFAFMFVREALPAAPWSWTVGGLGVALEPLLGFVSGTVNPDALLFAVSGAAFYCLARGFRRGLTRRLAIVLGAVTAVGFATKLNFLGLAPGVLLGLILLSVRAARDGSGRAAYLSLAIGLSIALSPVLLYVLLHVASGGHTLGIVSSGILDTHGSPFAEASYIWQLYLPRLPGMHDYFAGLQTTRQLWFDHIVGLYGWLDTPFPSWVENLALLPAAIVAGLCLRSLVIGRASLIARRTELLVYCVMVLGLMVLIGADSYLGFPKVNAEYAQARYLLPVVPLLGLVYALCARAAGRRWGPALGALLIMGFLAYEIASQLQVVARFYG